MSDLAHHFIAVSSTEQADDFWNAPGMFGAPGGPPPLPPGVVGATTSCTRCPFAGCEPCQIREVWRQYLNQPAPTPPTWWQRIKARMRRGEQ